MVDIQKIKNRLGTIYISLIILIVFLALTSVGIKILDIIDILLLIDMLVLLQKKLVKLKTLCIMSIVFGLIIVFTCKGISIILAVWLVIYASISLVKIKNINE